MKKTHEEVGQEDPKINQIRDLISEWENFAGSDSVTENAFGVQVVSVQYAVNTIRDIIDG